MQQHDGAKREVVANLTRFVGAGIALSQNWGKWCTWDVLEKHMSVEPTGKRVHNCDCWGDPNAIGWVGSTKGLQLGRWHRTICPFLDATHSAEFPIAWLNPNPAMTALDDFRETRNEYE